MKVPYPLDTKSLPWGHKPKLLAIKSHDDDSNNPSPFTAFANTELSPLENCEEVAHGVTPVDVVGAAQRQGGKLEHAMDTATPIADPRRKVRVKASQLTVKAAAKAAEAVAEEKFQKQIDQLLASPNVNQQEQQDNDTESRLKEMKHQIEQPKQDKIVVSTNACADPHLVQAPWSQTVSPISNDLQMASQQQARVAVSPISSPAAANSPKVPTTTSAPAQRIHELWSARNNMPETESGKKPTEGAEQYTKIPQDTDTDSQGTITGDDDDDSLSNDSDSLSDTISNDGHFEEDEAGEAAGKIEPTLCSEDDLQEEFGISPTSMETLTRALSGELSGDENGDEEEEQLEAAQLHVPDELQVVELLGHGQQNRAKLDYEEEFDEETMEMEIGAPESTPIILTTTSAAALPRGSTKLRCTCTKTKCLKLYCECFSTGILCEGGWCKCTDCYNDKKPAHREQRDAAIKKLLKKKGKVAFRNTSLEKKQAIAQSEGCNCKKSRCIKKYCECYSAGLVCRTNCKCEDCGNNGDVPPPPIKRKRKSRAKKHLAAYKTAAAAENIGTATTKGRKKKKKRARRN